MNVWLRLMVLSARRKKKKNLLTAPHCGRSLFHERDEIFMTIEAQSEACEMREKDKHKQARDRIGINWLCIYRMMLTCPCWCATRSDICLTRSAFELSKVFFKNIKESCQSDVDDGMEIDDFHCSWHTKSGENVFVGNKLTSSISNKLLGLIFVFRKIHVATIFARHSAKRFMSKVLHLPFAVHGTKAA